MNKVFFNKTKIVATVGPSCSDKKTLKKLILTGVDVFRLNFSHSDISDHLKVINLVREINTELGAHVALLQDLQGPKLRIGAMEEGTVIKKGRELIISTKDFIGNSQRISTSYQSLPKEIEPGEIILIDDGVIELKVTGVKKDEIFCKVVHGGPVRSKKGMNLPDTKISVPSLSKKDIEDLAFGIENDIEWVALSFVRTVKDVIELKKIIEKSGKFIKVIAKIEKPEALVNIAEIINEADGIMVARGDLGVEIPPEEVPLYQKQIVELCNIAAKPVIIATQMMESMIENPRPTRAETNDVANSVMDGADAVMLSGETAVGKFPVKVVVSMIKTVVSVESHRKLYYRFHDLDRESPIFLNDSLVNTAVKLAMEINADAIIGMTQSGYTAYKVASYRPDTDIFIFTANKSLLKTLNLVWGVRAFYYDKMVSTDDTIQDLERMLKRVGLLKKGQIYINMASMPIHAKERTNMLKINVVK